MRLSSLQLLSRDVIRKQRIEAGDKLGAVALLVNERDRCRLEFAGSIPGVQLGRACRRATERERAATLLRSLSILE
jgi:hypothetical protein